MRIPFYHICPRLPINTAVRLQSRLFRKSLVQNTWKIMAAQYSNGSRQSPIDIVSGGAVKDRHLLERPLEFSRREAIFSLTNTGSTIDANTTSEYILSGGPLENSYNMLGFHFHWQNQHELTAGSEHKLDGKAFASELHIVHMNRQKYKTFSNALNFGDGLSVLGVFLELTSEEKGHAGLERLCEALQEIQLRGSNTEMKTPLCPYSLLPTDTQSYWTYPGSLTTAPFSECVTWIVFRDPIKVSVNQLAKFRSLTTVTPDDADGMGHINNFPHICHNVRETFPLGSRVLKASF